MGIVEKRTHRRYSAGFEGKLIYNNVDYPAFIGNISKSGLYIIVLLGKTAGGITTEAQLKMRMYSPIDDLIALNCRKIWCHRTVPPHTLSSRMGLEIINPPSKYIKFVETLTNEL
jgi:hypothetical protein